MLKVLIVDDSLTIRQELRRKMLNLGHEVVGEAVNGLEALDMVQRLQPDLILLDIIMPEMDGIECYRLLRNLSYPPRCIIISALAQEPRVIAAYRDEIAADHFLDKFCLEEDIDQRIQMVLDQPPLPIPLPERPTDNPV